jgi:hypothetical protein
LQNSEQPRTSISELHFKKYPAGAYGAHQIEENEARIAVEGEIGG